LHSPSDSSVFVTDEAGAVRNQNSNVQVKVEFGFHSLTQETVDAAFQHARIRIVLDGGQFEFAPSFHSAAGEGKHVHANVP
jgi:hypothetical protein